MLEPRQISARGCKMRMLDRMAIALPLALTASGAIGQAADALAVAPNRSSAAKPMLIVALGDSTTATARDWAPEIQEVYADCLPKALASHGISAVVINAGLGDTTTRAAILRLDHDVRRYHPDLVIVQFGINDSWIDVDEGQQVPRLSRSEFRKNLKTIVRRLKRDGTLVVLMTPNPMRWSGSMGADRNWQRAEFGIGTAVPFYHDVLWIAAAGGSRLGSNLPADRLFGLGGPVSLPGYELYELRAGAYWTISGSYLRQIKDISPLRGQSLYAGLRLQDSEASDTFHSTSHGQIQSVMLYITGRTPVGPVTLGFATTTENSRSVWLSLADRSRTARSGAGGSSAEAQAAAPRMISGSFFRLPRRRSGSISRRAGEWRARVGTAPIGKTP